MKSELLPSWLIITTFWCAVLAIFSGDTLVSLLFILPFQLMIPFVCLVLGGVGMYAYRQLHVLGIAEDVKQGVKRRGISVNMGGLPMQSKPEYANVGPEVFEGTINFASYKAAFPKHAALILAVARVIATKPGLPASPVAGGHGGATLMQHSLRVVKAILSLAPTWQFRGLKKRNGEIDTRYPVRDPRGYYNFDQSDPMLPILAFAHDIGKVVCYNLEEDGTVSERTETSLTFSLGARTFGTKKMDHDTEGAKLLRRMPELWDLPHEDVASLLLAVGFYHKIGSYPVGNKISDRCRAMVDLLIDADQLAGRIEMELPQNEDVPVRANPDRSDSGERIEPTLDEPTKKVASAAPVQSQALPQQPEATQAYSQPAAPVVKADVWPGWSADRIYDAFASVLHEEDRVNGKNAKLRVAFKFEDWVYVCDWRLRKAIADRYADDTLNRVPVKGHAHPWVVGLLESLSEKGALLQSFEDKRFHAKSSLFVVYGPGQQESEKEFYFVFKASEFDRLQGIADCKTKPNLSKPAWANRAIRATASTQEEVVEADGAESPDEAHDFDAKLREVREKEAAQGSAPQSQGTDGGGKKQGGRPPKRGSIMDAEAVLSSLEALPVKTSPAKAQEPEEKAEPEKVPADIVEAGLAENEGTQGEQDYMEDPMESPEFALEMSPEMEEPPAEGAIKIPEDCTPFVRFLLEVASGHSAGPAFERRNLMGRDVVLFEEQEARVWFQAEDSDMEGLEVARGSDSGRMFIIIEV